MASVNFFDRQFRKQIKAASFELNPFEILSLDFLQGRILDLGAGLGNLSLEAARRGHSVLAVEGSEAAVERIARDAAAERLAVVAVVGDAMAWKAEHEFDTVISIGLLMFFRKLDAYRLLRRMQNFVSPGGRLIINVLIEGTDFMDMFEGDNFHLFNPDELTLQFEKWDLLLQQRHTFAAPHGTSKVFLTLIFDRSV